MNTGEEVSGGLVIAGGDGSELLKLTDEILDEMTHSRPQQLKFKLPVALVQRPPGRDVVHRRSASPTTSGGSGQSSVSQMARSSSASRTVTCWFARMQAAQATTIRRLMAGTD